MLKNAKLIFQIDFIGIFLLLKSKINCFFEKFFRLRTLVRREFENMDLVDRNVDEKKNKKEKEEEEDGKEEEKKENDGKEEEKKENDVK